MHARRLAVVHDNADQATASLRVAFASSDRKVLDQHFGSATSFAVYEIGPSSSRFVEVLTFEAEAQDGNEGKLAVRLEALKTCHAVFAQAIGASAVGQLKRIGVHAQKADKGTPIPFIVSEIQNQFRSAPAPWIAQAMAGPKEENRFDTMDEEGWDE